MGRTHSVDQFKKHMIDTFGADVSDALLKIVEEESLKYSNSVAEDGTDLLTSITEKLTSRMQTLSIDEAKAEEARAMLLKYAQKELLCMILRIAATLSADIGDLESDFVWHAGRHFELNLTERVTAPFREFIQQQIEESAKTNSSDN